MSLSQEQLAWIEDQITHDPGLQDRLLACGGPDEAAALIVARAGEHGVSIDEGALQRHFAQQSRALDDETLDKVSGAGIRKSSFS